MRSLRTRDQITAGTFSNSGEGALFANTAEWGQVELRNLISHSYVPNGTSTFPNSADLVKGGIVLADPDSGAVQKIIVLQYDPDTFTRTLQPQGFKEGSDRSEVLGLGGRPIETIMEVEFSK